MNNFLFTTFLFSIICSAACAMHKKENSNKEVVGIIKNYSKQLEEKSKIELTSYGLSYAGSDKVYDGKIHEIEVGYRIDKRMKYNEARDLFYLIVDGLLDEINRDKRIQHYFYHTPVGYQDLWFSLSFDYSGKGYLKKDDVMKIYIFENRISYLIVEKEDDRPANRYRRADFEIEHMLSTTRAIDRDLPEDPEASEDPALEQKSSSKKD